MKRATLTFDNGPTEDVTPFVLDELGQRSLVARFCVVGTQLATKAAPDLARRTLKEGHQLVNHSMTHSVALGDEPTVEHATREVGEMHDLMTEALGDWGEPWFRPFGRGGEIGPHIFSQAALEQLVSLRYSVLLWNCIPRDWEDTKGWVENALADIEKNEHTVVVLHDLPTGAMRHLPRFRDELARRDVVISDELPPKCVPLRRGRAMCNLAGMTQDAR